MAAIRASQTDEKAKQCRERNRITKVTNRAAKTQLEREQICEQECLRWATSQATMTGVERDQHHENVHFSFSRNLCWHLYDVYSFQNKHMKK